MSLVKPWFKMFNDLVWNRKFRRVSDAHCWRYVKICALHNAGKYEGSNAADIAEDMRLDINEYKTTIKALKKAKLLEKNGTIHDWSEMQRVRDWSSERAAKSKQTKEKTGKVQRNGNDSKRCQTVGSNAPVQSSAEQKGLTPLGNPTWKGDPSD